MIVIMTVVMAAFLMSPASAAVFEDEEAGYTIEYDDESWAPMDIEIMFGDIGEFDRKLVSAPFVVTNEGESEAGVIVIVSERDGYGYDMFSFIKDVMGELVSNEIYEGEDVFTDSNGDEFDSKVRVWGIAPEFEDEGILLSQIFMVDEKRYEVCFLALSDNFINAWEAAVEIIDSIDIE